MSKLGKSIIKGLEQAVGHARGEVEALEHEIRVPAAVDVKAIRTRAGMTQHEFATFYGFKLSALQAWEQRRRRPNLSARILLRVVEREPDAVRRALTA